MIVFFILTMSVLFSIHSTHAENTLELQECEKAMLKGFSTADILQKKYYAEYLNLEGVTAIAKSQNIDTYDRTYACHVQAVCYGVRNANTDNTFIGGTGQCIPITVGDIEKELDTDFSSCTKNFLSREQRAFERCDGFAQQKIEMSRRYLQAEFIKEVHLENQTLLAQKVLDLREKMTVLIEKVRAFSTHFIKIIDDVNCTSPDPSGK